MTTELDLLRTRSSRARQSTAQPSTDKHRRRGLIILIPASGRAKASDRITHSQRQGIPGPPENNAADK
jgi:hypothetical protein